MQGNHSNTKPSPLPWWTWVLPFFIANLGTWLSIWFKTDPGASLWYLPTALGIVMVYWWGPRVLLGIYLNAVVCAPLWDLPWQWSLLYALPETLEVGLSWLFFIKIAQGKCWLSNLRNVATFLLFGSLVPTFIANVYLVIQLYLLGDIPQNTIWENWQVVFSADLVTQFVLTVPLLVLFTKPMQEKGWTQTKDNIPPLPLLPESRNSLRDIIFIIALLATALVAILTFSIHELWILHGFLLILIAARYGLKMAVISTSWIGILAFLLPIILTGKLGLSTLTYGDFVSTNFYILFLCGVTLLTGRAISDLFIVIAERKQVEDELRDSEELHRVTLTNISDAVFITDDDGKFTYICPNVNVIFNYTKVEVAVFGNIRELLGIDFFDLDELVRSKEIQNIERLVTTKAGVPRVLLVNVKRVSIRGGTVLYTCHDVTEPKRIEEEIHQRLSELEVLYQSSIALSQLVNPKVIAQNIINILDQKMDWHHTAISLYHQENETLELLAFNHPNLNSDEERGAVEELFKSSIAKTDQGLSGWVVEHHQVVWTGDLKNDPRYVETFPNLQSGLYVPIKIAQQAIGVISIESEQAHAFSKADERLVVILAAQAAIAINNAQLFDDLQRSNTSLTLAYDATIEGWSHALDLRDRETEGHTLRVTIMTLELARAMHINESQLTNIRRGALLHDIGKMGVPDRILLKPGQLTDEEWEIMRRHPVYAYEMLTPIRYLETALDIPYCHHEKWDGTGYPRGLKADEIPLVARIFAIVDVWDALTSDRPYRQAWPKEKGLEYIRGESGKHFDPHGVETFIKLVSNM